MKRVTKADHACRIGCGTKTLLASSTFNQSFCLVGISPPFDICSRAVQATDADRELWVTYHLAQVDGGIIGQSTKQATKPRKHDPESAESVLMGDDPGDGGDERDDKTDDEEDNEDEE